jgi:hypothetical protein
MLRWMHEHKDKLEVVTNGLRIVRLALCGAIAGVALAGILTPAGWLQVTPVPSILGATSGFFAVLAMRFTHVI